MPSLWAMAPKPLRWVRHYTRVPQRPSAEPLPVTVTLDLKVAGALRVSVYTSLLRLARLSFVSRY